MRKYSTPSFPVWDRVIHHAGHNTASCHCVTLATCRGPTQELLARDPPQLINISDMTIKTQELTCLVLV